ncbi:MAG: TonB-dependent receptor [Hyphomicrobiales bacterium]|nr:TonB-dependent receptor [Hyphomicrobiales bacterium]
MDNNIKRPTSLRQPASSIVSPSRELKQPVDSSAIRAGIIAVSCMSVLGPASDAFAQAANELPAMTVEAPREARPARARPAPRQARPRTAARPAQRRPAVAAAPATAPQAPANASGTQGTGAAGAPNPYADAAAPYKVNRSSSNKLTQPLLDTARSVTTIPKEVIEDKGATSFRELVRTMPGLTLGTGEGGNAYGDRVFIRGFDARNDMYVDGVRDPGVNIRENFYTEQVEILKGPSSVVGGRGTTGGAVNVVTKKPAFVDFHEAGITFGTDRTKRVTFDVNKVVTPEIAVRANGMWQEAGVAGRDYVFDNRWGGAFGVTWKPSERFSMTLDYVHVDIDQLPDWGVPFDVRTRRPFTESGLSRRAYYGIPSRDFQRAKQDIWTANAELKPNDWMTVSNKLRYGTSLLDYVVGAPGTPNLTNPDPSQWTVNSTAKSRRQKTDVLVNQTDVTMKFPTFGVLHTLVAGVEFSSEKSTRDSYRALDTETNVIGAIPGIPLNLFNPQVGSIGWNDRLQLAGLPTSINIDTKSAYILDTLNFGEKLFLTGGVRLDDYAIDTTSVGAATTTYLKRDDLLFNWNVGATYKIRPTWAVYAAYGTSSNPVGAEIDGGGNDYGGLSAQNVAAGPERNTSAEVGMKAEFFDRRLLATVALFQTTKENARETQGAGAAATVVGGGEYEVRGIEIGLGGKIDDRWSVFGGAVFMDSEVTRSLNAANVGRQLANIAHTSFNILTKYDLTEKFTIGGQATYKSRIFGGTLAANENVLPESWRFDLFGEYRFSRNVTGKINIQNITNAVIYDAFYRSTAPYVYVAPGRSATVSLNFKY